MSRADDLTTIMDLARYRDGVVCRRDLLKAGIGRGAIEKRIASGLLARVLDGVYLLGARELSQRQLFWSGLLHAGPSSALAGYSAAEHRRLLRPKHGRATVATPRAKMKPRVWTDLSMVGGQKASITVRHSSRVVSQVVDELPVISMARTLIEVGHDHGERFAGWAWAEADFRGMLDLNELRSELRDTRRPGSKVLKRLLATMPEPIAPTVERRSRHEVDFLHLVRQYGLPEPEANVRMRIGGANYVADFYYPALGLVVEVDDPSHDRQVARSRDRVRDVEFLIAGLVVARFETHRLTTNPDACMKQLKALIARQSQRTLT